MDRGDDLPGICGRVPRRPGQDVGVPKHRSLSVGADGLLARVLAWAAADDNIRLVVLTGSHARGAEDTDALSDLDIELYARDPSALLEGEAWYSQFGTVLAVEALPNPGWHPTRLLYLAGAKIDFMIAPVDAVGQAGYDRPFRVLIDKDRQGLTLREEPPVGQARPDADAFSECVNWFFAAAIMCAKCIRRGEPWMAKARDWDLKVQLLRTIEWDHKARYGWSCDTWYNGKHLTRWADQDVRDALDGCWAGFSLQDAEAALRASVDLFERLATRTSLALGLAPVDCGPVRQEITLILSSRV
jgi:aminoglycoside 6-adenylyltransferase